MRLLACIICALCATSVAKVLRRDAPTCPTGWPNEHPEYLNAERRRNLLDEDSPIENFRYELETEEADDGFREGKEHVFSLRSDPTYAPIKGFFIIASVLDVNCGFGSFADNFPRVSEHADCPNVLMNSDTNDKYLVSFSWIAPTCGCVNFRASVLTDANEFYIDDIDTSDGALTRTICPYDEGDDGYYYSNEDSDEDGEVDAPSTLIINEVLFPTERYASKAAHDVIDAQFYGEEPEDEDDDVDDDEDDDETRLEEHIMVEQLEVEIGMPLRDGPDMYEVITIADHDEHDVEETDDDDDDDDEDGVAVDQTGDDLDESVEEITKLSIHNILIQRRRDWMRDNFGHSMMMTEDHQPVRPSSSEEDSYEEIDVEVWMESMCAKLADPDFSRRVLSRRRRGSEDDYSQRKRMFMRRMSACCQMSDDDQSLGCVNGLLDDGMRHVCSAEESTMVEKQIIVKRKCCPKIDLIEKRQCVVHHIKTFQRQKPTAPQMPTLQQRQKMAMDMGDFVCRKLADEASREIPEEVGESEEIWQEHGEELRSCCQQEGEVRYACFRRTFLQKANRVCAGEEALPPFFPEHHARNILAECCATTGDDRVDCFGQHRHRYMQARKNVKLVVDPMPDRTSPQHLDRLICERFQQPFNIRSSGHRHSPNTMNQLKSCCAKPEEQRHQCLEQIMVSRVNNFCSSLDELPAYMPRSLRRMLLQNCCEATDISRVSCFGQAHQYEHGHHHDSHKHSHETHEHNHDSHEHHNATHEHSHDSHEHNHESHEHSDAGPHSHGSHEHHGHLHHIKPHRHHHHHFVSFEDALCRISHHHHHHNAHESAEEIPQGALVSCCEQSGESRKECIQTLRRQRADRVCAGTEELPAWHFSGEETALIKETCCVEEGNERYTCFNNTMQGKREELKAKKIQFFKERLSHRQRVRVARMCNHMYHDHSEHSEAMLSRVPPQKRQHMRLIWEQRRADMAQCCAMITLPFQEGSERMNCVRTMRRDRIDRVCELGEPLVMAHVPENWDSVHPVASNCCLADGDERYHCFNESLIKGEMKPSRWHLNWNGHAAHEEHHAHHDAQNISNGHPMLRRCCESGKSFARDNRFTRENALDRCSNGASSFIETEDNCPRCERFFTRCCVKTVASSRSNE